MLGSNKTGSGEPVTKSHSQSIVIARRPLGMSLHPPVVVSCSSTFYGVDFPGATYRNISTSRLGT
jgi:hypothetical protein